MEDNQRITLIDKFYPKEQFVHAINKDLIVADVYD